MFHLDFWDAEARSLRSIGLNGRREARSLRSVGLNGRRGQRTEVMWVSSFLELLHEQRLACSHPRKLVVDMVRVIVRMIGDHSGLGPGCAKRSPP